ncbi:MAG: type II toxin-antitoxin system VapC family toxin [Solirubrobacterales bacterium]
MIVLDTSFVFALIDANDARHREAAGWYHRSEEPTATTPFVLAELDHLVPRAGADAVRGFRGDVSAGAYRVEWWPELARDAAITAEGYADLGVSLTDASLAVLAARLETDRIATFDERHFRAMRPLSRFAAFTLLPVDAG